MTGTTTDQHGVDQNSTNQSSTNQTGVDLTEAMTRNLAKKTQRDSQRHHDNEKLK